MKKNATKRSLALSILSLVLCVAMLLGTTFAWFTDSVTSGRNRIVAGNLDVEMYHWTQNNGTADDPIKVDGETDLFPVDYWEPGVVVYENFTVKNKGTLALKYNFALNVFDYNSIIEMDTNDVYDLRSALKVLILDESFNGDREDAIAAFRAEDADVKAFTQFNDTDWLPAEGKTATENDETKTDSKSFSVLVYWEPTAEDNHYNVSNNKHVEESLQGVSAESAGNALFIDFGINLVATQKEYEDDSFNNQYDLNAEVWDLHTDGSWYGRTSGNLLVNTDRAYATLVTEQAGIGIQPVKIIPLTADGEYTVGTGKITVDGTDITYTNTGDEQDIVIKTNSFDNRLTINAPKDTVRHYGFAFFVDVQAVASESFHEHGVLGRMKVTKGRAVVHKTGTVYCAMDMDGDGTVAVVENDEANISNNMINITDITGKKEGDEGFANIAKEQTSGVADGYVRFCKNEEHTYRRFVIDHSHVYNVCTCCGYVLDAGNISFKNDTAATEEEKNETGQIESISDDVDMSDVEDEEKVFNCPHEHWDYTANGKDCVATCSVCGVKYTTHHMQFNTETGRLYYNCPCCHAAFGTSELPYELHNAAEFEGLLRLRETTTSDKYDAYRLDAGGYLNYLYVELANDIDCSTVIWPANGTDAYYLEWDGKGHTLSNIDTDGSVFKYACYWMILENTVFDDCRMGYLVQYPYYGEGYPKYEDFYCGNLTFKDCEFGGATFEYFYDSHMIMKDCLYDGCTTNGISLVAYGGYKSYGLATGADLINVDVKHCKTYGGAYIYYGYMADNINFKDCDVTNTDVYGGQGMALGGFVGNASTSHVSFDTCTFDGYIESASQIAAGFIGQPNSGSGTTSFKNCSVSEDTVIVNKGDGGCVAAFAGQGVNASGNGNSFNGTLSAKAESNMETNGFEKGDLKFIAYGSPFTAEDFALNLETGELTYTGTADFDKIIVKQELYSFDIVPDGHGGYPWTPQSITKDVTDHTATLATLKIFKSYMQLVDEEDLATVRCSTADASILDGAESLDDENNAFYFNSTTGQLICDCRKNGAANCFILNKTYGDKATPATQSVSVRIMVYRGQDMVGSISVPYSMALLVG